MADWTCGSCGGANPAGMRFCGHCGSPAPAAESPAPPSVEPHDARPARDAALRSFVSAPVAERIVEAGGPIAEERRLITALFADISGFTALAQRVDTEELLEIVDPIVSRLSSIVGRYEGYVEKFAGDALLALFGAPVTHEDDAERALRVALEMHAELAAIRADLPAVAAGLTLHVGINSGHGIARILGSEARMDYAVLGDSVILAQRLESQTPGGETYVGETTVRLARGRFRFEPVGELAVKGKAEPVPAWRLIGPGGAQPSAGIEVAGPGPGRVLVGRGRELATLVAALDRQDRGAVVAVVGEPGIGKSTLVAALAAAASERGIRWLPTRCISYGAALSYRPIAELIRLRASILPDDPLGIAATKLGSALADDGAPEAGPHIARLLGLPPDPAPAPADGAADAGVPIADLEPEAFRRALHERIVGWLRSLAAAGPVAILVEDLHWADGPTVDLLAEIVSAAGAAPIVVCATARPEGSPQIDRLREAAGAGAADWVVAVELGPLDAAGVADLVDEVLGGPAPAGLAPALEDRSGGNPFFVEEIVRALREEGALTPADGTWRLRAGWDAADVPPTVEGVLAGRIDRLPGAANRVLQVAAVIGRRVRDGLLAGVLPDEFALDAHVGVLVDAGLLDRVLEAGRPILMFHHALVQDVAYGRILRRRRRELHGRVADVAESLYGAGDDTIDLLARHRWLAGVGGAAMPYLVRAAERGRRLFANAEAIAWFGRAAEIAREDPEVADRLPGLLLAEAEVHELIGAHDAALARYREVVHRTGDVRAWRGVASVLRKRREYREALATLDAGQAALSGTGADVRGLWLERGWTLSLEGRLTEARSALAEGLASGEDDPVRADLLVQLARVHIVGGDPATGLDRADQAARIFEVAGVTRGLATADRVAGDALRELGRMDDAADRLRRGIATAERVGSSEELGAGLVNLGKVESDRARYEAAAEALERAASEFRRAGNHNGVLFAESNLAEALVRWGRWDEGARLATAALELARRSGNDPVAADILDTLAMAAGAAGDARAEARQYEAASATYEAVEELGRAAETAGRAADAWRRAADEQRARDSESRARMLRERAASTQP